MRLLAWWKEVSSRESDLPILLDDIVRRLGFTVATYHVSAHPGTLGYLEPGEDLIFLRAGLPEAVRRFTGKGLAGFLQKPYTAATLADTIKRIIDERGPQL